MDDAPRGNSRTSRRVVAAYLLAVAASVIAAGVRWALDPLLGGTGEYLTFYFSVLFVAIAAGTGAGVLAAVLGAVLGRYLFVQSGHLDAVVIDDAIRLVLFFTYGATALALVDRLRRSEARAARLRQSSQFPEENPNPVFRLDAAGRFLYSNDACARHFVADCEAGSEAPEPARAVARLAVQSAMPFQHEVDLPGRDGRTFSFTCVGVPDRQYANFYGRDVTEARAARRELDAERARWKHVVEGIADEVWVCDVGGRMGLVNLPAVTHMGLKEFRDKSIQQVLDSVEILNPDGSVRPERDAPLFRALSGETVRGEEIMRDRRTGSQRWRQFSAAPIRDATGAIVGSVAVVRDVTDYRRMDADLRQAHGALKEADRRKDEFIALLSHELRNPLAPIRYALPIVQREPLGETAARAMQVMERQVAHLTRLIDDLLDVSRITRGKIELRRERAALASIVSAATEAVSPAIAAAHHQLDVVVADEPLWVYVDSARIAQVITNLLDNSVKYTPPGGRITLEASREGGQAVIRVRDRGIGIPAEALGQVFDMFRQVKRPDNPQGGLGIGLALVKQLVELHGGTIDVHSAGIGKGAQFVVRLPLVEPVGIAAAPGNSATIAPRRSLKVLVVDDNADLVEMLAVTIEGLGHDVRRAFDGVSALSDARTYRPDVVLLDLGLPGLGGIEVARQLRRIPEMSQVTLVALTGWGQPEDRMRTRDAGFACHLTKPTDPKVLERLLAEFAACRADL